MEAPGTTSEEDGAGGPQDCTGISRSVPTIVSGRTGIGPGDMACGAGSYPETGVDHWRQENQAEPTRQEMVPRNHHWQVQHRAPGREPREAVNVRYL
jgi:hypothetical protein